MIIVSTNVLPWLKRFSLPDGKQNVAVIFVQQFASFFLAELSTSRHGDECLNGHGGLIIHRSVPGGRGRARAETRVPEDRIVRSCNAGRRPGPPGRSCWRRQKFTHEHLEARATSIIDRHPRRGNVVHRS